MSNPIFRAVLSNPDHPEYGAVTIPFPAPQREYDSTIEMLDCMGVGNATMQDCKVEEIAGRYPVLRRLEGTQVNVDELDYLAKRLESFCVGEDAQFQAMAEKLDLHSITDFINLTFCCQRATVITDFSNLKAVGRAHYMNLHGGVGRTEELEALDGRETALLLIGGGGGTITPYGVVYDNGMKLEMLYEGNNFPPYLYDQYPLALTVTPKGETVEQKQPIWIPLPSTDMQIDRALQRGGISASSDVTFEVDWDSLPEGISERLDFSKEPIMEINAMCAAIMPLSSKENRKLGAVVAMVKPDRAVQVCRLAEKLDLFDFAPNAHTPAELGKYMIKESGHFEYDPNLEAFYDYEKYGLRRMEEKGGIFTEQGYIAYEGIVPLQELLTGDTPRQKMSMDEMSL